MYFSYKRCFTFVVESTVIVLSILLLITWPVIVLVDFRGLRITAKLTSRVSLFSHALYCGEPV